MTAYFGVVYSPKLHLTLIKLTASGSLLVKALCSAYSHVPTAHVKPSTPQTPL